MPQNREIRSRIQTWMSLRDGLIMKARKTLYAGGRWIGDHVQYLQATSDQPHKLEDVCINRS